MKGEKSWKRELARDFIALGSIPFFLLVIARITLMSNSDYLLQFIVSGLAFAVIFIFLKQDIYSGLALIVLYFTTLYYGVIEFTIFASFAYLLIVASLWYLEYSLKKIALGIISAVISVLVVYLII